MKLISHSPGFSPFAQFLGQAAVVCFFTLAEWQAFFSGNLLEVSLNPDRIYASI